MTRAAERLFISQPTMSKQLKELEYVGAPESESMMLFAEVVASLQKDYPGIRCNIYSGNLEDVCDRLEKGLLDFAIVMSYVDL